MGLKGFNEQSEKTRYIYRPNALVPHCWQLFEYKEEKMGYEPIGEYTLIDTSEAEELTEKHLMNLITLLNGKTNLVNLTHLTNTRLLYNIIPTAPDSNHIKIILRSHDGKGVSKENAVLTIEKGVFNESSKNDGIVADSP